MTAPKEVNFIALREEWFKENPTAYEVVTGKTEEYRTMCLSEILENHDSQVQALKADLEALVKMYSPKIKRNCQHDDPSWCNEFCNDYGHLARQIGDKNGIKHE